MADGKLRAVSWDNLRTGAVLRMVSEDGSCAQHSDSTVVSIYSDSRSGETVVKLVRPYMIVDRETHSWSVGFEQYEVPALRMMGPENFRWQVVCYDSGEPASVLRLKFRRRKGRKSRSFLRTTETRGNADMRYLRQIHRFMNVESHHLVQAGSPFNYRLGPLTDTSGRLTAKEIEAGLSQLKGVVVQSHVSIDTIPSR